MRIILGLIAVAALAIGAPMAAADLPGCDRGVACDKTACDMPCCKNGCDMPCCAQVPSVIVPPIVTDIPTPPARQSVTVLFRDPVKVGDRILMGKYIIEHDNDRMARGKPCTHIYDADDPRLPVVAFHCTHLTRPRSESNTVTLRPWSDTPGRREMTEFQFAGETAAHGVPKLR
jgi:hypothetical protein